MMVHLVDALLRAMVKTLLWLRYRIRVRGLDEVATRGTRGILFLPNHPALIDPIILSTYLHKAFAPKFLADQDQIDRPVVRMLAARVGVLPIPDVAKYGGDASAAINAALQQMVGVLNAGGNALLYPAGQLCRQHQEDLRGNSGVQTVLRGAPDVRVVLIRTRGLWGSSLGWATGRPPDLKRTFRKGVLGLLLSGLFFGPRRHLDIELVEPDDVPRGVDRDTINGYLEAFYNADVPPNTYVPYSVWERGGRRVMPEPDSAESAAGLETVPPGTREIVTAHLRELTGIDEPADEAHLARDLGLDSLARTDLLVWLEDQFGFAQGDTDSLLTVGDVMLAACGEGVSVTQRYLKPPPRAWFAANGTASAVTLAEGRTVPEVFLNQMRRGPGRIAMADQTSGARSYRDALTAIILLRDRITALAGDRVGIMLPASVAASTVYLATLFAGKIPVMFNWTVGRRNLDHALESVGVRRVLTAAALLSRLKGQGLDLGAVRDRCVCLEDIAKGISTAAKLRAALKARRGRVRAPELAATDTAAILFTSGSETLPKAVPLSHENLLTNLGDVLRVVTVRPPDKLIGMLPPFHSFGLTGTVAAPLLAGFPVVYHPNPTEAGALAAIVETYQVTVLMGTPTFLGGIVRAARAGQLDTLRLAVTGAERCTRPVYEALARRCPNLTILEGYGVTECSPIISLNDEHNSKAYSIGKILPSLEHVVLDEQRGTPAELGDRGVLLVRGPSVFGGYLDYDGASPFVDHDGKPWYRTGDLVCEDADGVLTFLGRLKRFVKLGGEMISLPAIEAALEPLAGEEDHERPILAVVATDESDHPELVLFAAAGVDRRKANEQIRKSGLSSLHNVHRVVHLEELPVLGTGKTDYRELKRLLSEER